MTIITNLNPGSDEAIKAGCTCPVLDNAHGAGTGYKDSNGDPLYWIEQACPIHSKEST